MLCIKKLYREELLQLALLLSLLRVDPESYLGLDIQTIGVGSLDLHNGSGWHTDSHTIVHRPMFVHPKNPDSMLLNYERDLFAELNSLGRYNRMNSGLNDIHAYLLNIEESNGDVSVAGPSELILTNSTRNITSPDPPTSTQSPAEPIDAAELTQEIETIRELENILSVNKSRSKELQRWYLQRKISKQLQLRLKRFNYSMKLFPRMKKRWTFPDRRKAAAAKRISRETYVLYIAKNIGIL